MLMDADIDIDFGDRNAILELIKHIPARLRTNSESKKHNSGVYVTDIPNDPMCGCASIDFKEAENRGYFKIDFLNVNVYRHIETQSQYDELFAVEPPWHLLHDKEFCSGLIHIGNYHDLIIQMNPNSITRMAMFLALIRPSKRYLIGKSWKEISKEIWVKPNGDGYYFKKAHAVSYAVLVTLHMNIINQHHELK